MEKEKGNNSSLRYAGLATQWMVMLLLGVWAGYKIDQWLKWNFPLFLILFPLASLIFSLYGIIKEFNKKK